MQVTVGMLKQMLEAYPDEWDLEFQGGLGFSRLKTRGSSLVVLEFSEPQADLSKKFKRRNPHVKVAFVHGPSMGPGDIVKSVDVGVD